jgi:hypothetical protein
MTSFRRRNPCYESEELMFENTVFKLEAIPLILVINASETIVKSNAYSTRSWPFSLAPNIWNLTYSFNSALFIRVLSPQLIYRQALAHGQPESPSIRMHPR